MKYVLTTKRHLDRSKGIPEVVIHKCFSNKDRSNLLSIILRFPRFQSAV